MRQRTMFIGLAPKNWSRVLFPEKTGFHKFKVNWGVGSVDRLDIKQKDTSPNNRNL